MKAHGQLLPPFAARRAGSRFPALIGTLLLACVAVTAADFSVTSPGSFYSINGQSPNPTLTLVRGKTYTFAVSTASIHPFRILSPGTGSGTSTSSGTITYTVPTNAPASISRGYECAVHHFSGTILTVDPPAPPTIRILSLVVSNGLFLKSTGASNFGVLPEFKTNATSTNWFALTVQTNRFLNGTNETLCGKPPGDPVFIRIRSNPK